MPLKVIPRRDQKLNKLIKTALPVEYKKSNKIYAINDESSVVYLVHTGHVRLTLPRAGSHPRAGSDQPDRTVAVVGPAELFGEEAISLDIPRRYTAVAGSSCTLLPLSGMGVFNALRGSPKTLSTFFSMWDADLVSARRVAGLSGSSSKARIADVIMDLARRLGTEEGRKIRLEHWFTHQELADLAGAHRSTVTTVLNDWIYEGALKQGSWRPGRRREWRELIIAKPGTLRKAGLEVSRRRRRKRSTR